VIIDGLDRDIEAFIPFVLFIGSRCGEWALRAVASRWAFGAVIMISGTDIRQDVVVGIKRIGLLLEADSFFLFGWTAGAVISAVLACLVRRKGTDHVLFKHREGLFGLMWEDTEENVSNIFVVIVGEGLLASGMLIDEISQVQHFLLVEEEISLPMFGVADPVLEALLHRDNRRTNIYKEQPP
jgi:hypothetical protein